MIHRNCEYPNCQKKGRNKGFYKGETRYDRFCEFHHRLRYKTENRAYYSKKQMIDNSKCEKCGWDKANCDRHRIKAERGYFKENIMVLCPNCHRLAHI